MPRRDFLDRLYQGHEGGYTIVDDKTGGDSAESRQKWRPQLHRCRDVVISGLRGKVAGMEIPQLEMGTVLGETELNS